MTFWNAVEAAALGAFAGVMAGNLLLDWWKARKPDGERDLL